MFEFIADLWVIDFDVKLQFEAFFFFFFLICYAHMRPVGPPAEGRQNGSSKQEETRI